MTRDRRDMSTRRQFLEATLTVPAAYLLATSVRSAFGLAAADVLAAPQQVLPATPACPEDRKAHV